MARRLTELYLLQDRVEMMMWDEQWQPGVVVQHAHPAVWVRTDDGHFWFVTNRQRIRKIKQGEDES